MQLQLIPWPEAERRLATDTGIIIPIGSTEQHGPTGLLGTDALCAEAVARGIGETTGTLVAPTLGIGIAEHHMAFPGTITLRPSTLILVVRDVVLSLAGHGFRRFLLVNGHGGNIPTLRAAFSEIYGAVRESGSSGMDLRCKVMSWWENEAVTRLSREFYGGREGSHATPSEIAITRHLFPGRVADTALDPETAANGSFFDSRDLRRRYPDGRIGSAPGLATEEHGRRLLAAAIEAGARAARQFITEP